MKKSFSLVLAVASILTASASASALDVKVDNNPTQVDDVCASYTDIFARDIHQANWCGYRLNQISVNNPNVGALCNIKEKKPIFEPSCQRMLHKDAEAFVVGGEDYGTECDIVDSYDQILEVKCLTLHEDDDDDSRLEGEFTDECWEDHTFKLTAPV